MSPEAEAAQLRDRLVQLSVAHGRGAGLWHAIALLEAQLRAVEARWDAAEAGSEHLRGQMAALRCAIHALTEAAIGGE